MPSSMSPLRVFVLTLLTLVAFASNSLLCRLALKHTGIDAATFTSIRLIAGALTLYAIVRLRSEHNQPLGSWSPTPWPSRTPTSASTPASAPCSCSA